MLPTTRNNLDAFNLGNRVIDFLNSSDFVTIGEQPTTLKGDIAPLYEGNPKSGIPFTRFEGAGGASTLITLDTRGHADWPYIRDIRVDAQPNNQIVIKIESSDKVYDQTGFGNGEGLDMEITAKRVGDRIHITDIHYINYFEIGSSKLRLHSEVSYNAKGALQNISIKTPGSASFAPKVECSASAKPPVFHPGTFNSRVGEMGVESSLRAIAKSYGFSKEFTLSNISCNQPSTAEFDELRTLIGLPTQSTFNAPDFLKPKARA